MKHKSCSRNLPLHYFEWLIRLLKKKGHMNWQKQNDNQGFIENLIKKTSFYSRESEKTKLNWFCYEIALSIELDIKRNLGKQLMKYKIDDKAIAEFSIYYSKVMKDIILQKLNGKIKTVIHSYEPIESYFPKINDRMVNKMLDVIAKAWDEQLSVCVHCPNRCISEKDVYCTMFDNDHYK